ncbi:MAG: sugar phosphate isomerase/epimerase family protein [Armatimonadota bacterium]
MDTRISRRDLLAASGAAAVGLAAASAHGASADKPTAPMLKKAVVMGMLPQDLSIADRFKLARDLGFHGVEGYPESDPRRAERLRTAADDAGIEIHSIMYGGWDAPLSSPDPQVAARGVESLRAALRSAKLQGADTVLLVPAVVNEQTRYVEAYERSQKHIRSVIPLARELKVTIAVENVWNNFLLSPLEFARYVDEFRSPYVQAYFDVGNVMAFGWPQDWILTLGKRIRRIHLKDFRRGPRQFVNLRDGDVNWPEVRQALAKVGYSGYLTAELSGGNREYLADVSARMDKIIAGQ